MHDSAAGILIITFTFLLAGMVKGVIGMGLPTVAMGLLALVMPPVQAAVLLVGPSLVTNVWQLVAGPSFVALLKRFSAMIREYAEGRPFSRSRKAVLRRRNSRDGQRTAVYILGLTHRSVAHRPASKRSKERRNILCRALFKFRPPRELSKAMTGISMGAAMAIARKFPWAEYRTFVDVGAAQGGLAVQIAMGRRVAPSARLIAYSFYSEAEAELEPAWRKKTGLIRRRSCLRAG